MFAGAIDTVGGVILENIIKSTKSIGVVTCCGNVASPKLELKQFFPFILRGVTTYWNRLLKITQWKYRKNSLE